MLAAKIGKPAKEDPNAPLIPGGKSAAQALFEKILPWLQKERPDIPGLETGEGYPEGYSAWDYMLKKDLPSPPGKPPAKPSVSGMPALAGPSGPVTGPGASEAPEKTPPGAKIWEEGKSPFTEPDTAFAALKDAKPGLFESTSYDTSDLDFPQEPELADRPDWAEDIGSLPSGSPFEGARSRSEARSGEIGRELGALRGEKQQAPWWAREGSSLTGMAADSPEARMAGQYALLGSAWGGTGKGSMVDRMYRQDELGQAEQERDLRREQQDVAGLQAEQNREQMRQMQMDMLEQQRAWQQGDQVQTEIGGQQVGLSPDMFAKYQMGKEENQSRAGYYDALKTQAEARGDLVGAQHYANLMALSIKASPTAEQVMLGMAPSAASPFAEAMANKAAQGMGLSPTLSGLSQAGQAYAEESLDDATRTIVENIMAGRGPSQNPEQDMQAYIADLQQKDPQKARQIRQQLQQLQARGQ